MNQSRYIRYDKRRLPKEKRTVRVFGADTQSNKLFRCWNCGFICNTGRDKLGDGVGYTIKDVADSPAVLNAGASGHEFPGGNAQWDSTLSMDVMSRTINLTQLDSSGSPVTVRHNFTSVVTGGCPSCGCKQYK